MAMRSFVACILILLPASLLFMQEAGRYLPPRTADHGLIGMALRDNLTVSQGGARGPDGEIVIREGDRLLRWDGHALADRDDFCRRLYASKPGETVRVRIRRGDDELDVDVKLGDRHAAFANLYRHAENRRRTFSWREYAAMQGGPLREKLTPVFDEHELWQPWDDLLAAHERELDLWDSFESTSAVELLLSDPLASHQFTAHVGDAFAQAARADDPLDALAPILSRLLDREPVGAQRAAPERAAPEPAAPDRAAPERAWPERADAILSSIDFLKVAREAAGPEAWHELWQRVHDFEYVWRGQPGHERCVELVHAMRELQPEPARALPHIGWALRELEALARELYATHERGDELPLATPPGLTSGDAIAFESSYGLIAVAQGRCVWRGPDTPAVIVSLGGDNEYIDCAVTGPERPVSIIIDVGGGNNRYRATRKWGVAAGVLGTAIIYDKAGDDHYECPRWGIGAAFGGIGLIIDGAGNDRYLGGDYTIGAAAYGIGGVIDLAGNDLYVSHVHSIGSGQPGGIGFVLDGGGDDNYRCGGKYRSSYGTEGEYQGWGIGSGFGWRGLAGGGIGIVVNVAGNDMYDVGEFGLGCGYFMGVGMVRDLAGDDIYHSSRYGLATAAHAAVGLFMDDSGSDIYEGKTAASMAGVWDIATGYFYDGAGNDVYRADGLALGAASQNGAGIFWDAGGEDIYRANRRSIGHASGTDYAGGRLAKNFGIFINQGQASYPQWQTRETGTTVDSQYQVFIQE
jgi:hypothetical protein